MFAQSALLYSLPFVIINIYSVNSIYFGVGHLTLFRDIYYIDNFFLGRFRNQKFHHVSNIFCYGTKDGVYKLSEQLDTL